MNIIQSIENNISDLIKNGLSDNHLYWLPTMISPPERKPSDKRSSELKIMLYSIFQYKFPDYNPNFVIGWNPDLKHYRIGISSLGQSTSQSNKPENVLRDI